MMLNVSHEKDKKKIVSFTMLTVGLDHMFCVAKKVYPVYNVQNQLCNKTINNVVQ